MAQIRPFKIDIPDSKLEKLRAKLASSDFPDEVDDIEWDYGTPLENLKRVVTYWKDEFDWRAMEVRMNSLPHFMTTIDVEDFDPVDLHFVHAKSGVENAIPLLFVHGWPGSFLEVTKLLPILTSNDGGPVFDVVAPSLPNYVFSSGVRKRGFGHKQVTEIMDKLMIRLGYQEYAVQGGDWGSVVATVLANRFPDRVKAIHLNLVVTRPPPVTWPVSFLSFLARHALKWYTPAEKVGLERTQDKVKNDMGYFHYHSQRPQTVGYGYADSPVFLLATFMDRFHSWCDDYPWTDEELCTWVSLYYFSTAGPAAATRLYHEAQKGEWNTQKQSEWYIRGVKIGLSYFPKDFLQLPLSWAHTIGDSIVLQSQHDKGGHFASWEVPEALAKDLRTMFGKNGGAYDVIKGRSGYT